MLFSAIAHNGNAVTSKNTKRNDQDMVLFNMHLLPSRLESCVFY